MDDLGIRWQEPPERTHGRLPWAEWAAVLRANPGRWALLRTYPTPKGAQAAPYSTARLEHMPPKEYELRTARDAASGSALYGRYIGTDGDLDAN